MHEELRTSRSSYWPWLAFTMWTKPHARPQITLAAAAVVEYASATRAGRLIGHKPSFAACFDNVPRFFLIYGKFCGENIYRRGGGGLFSRVSARVCVCKKGKSEKKRRASILTPLKLSHLGTCGGLFGFRAHPSSPDTW